MPRVNSQEIIRARKLQAQMSTWIAAAYLKNRHWHIQDALYILLGVRSERRIIYHQSRIRWPDE